MGRARDDLPGNVMIALRRRDVAELNALARTLMDTHGRLGSERLQVGGAEFAAGDRIVCLRNSDALGVKNGTRGTVERVDPARRTLTVATDRGDRGRAQPALPRTGHVRHAYAITGHAGQGVTVERAFVLGIGGTRLQEWGYVALSRARTRRRLYVTAIPRERESHFHDLDDRDPSPLRRRRSRSPRSSGWPSTSDRCRPAPATRPARRSSAPKSPLKRDSICGCSSSSAARSKRRTPPPNGSCARPSEISSAPTR